MNYSIRNIENLPSPEHIKYVGQGLALLDAIIMPEWGYRYFSFNCNWDGAGMEMMCSMRDGSGAELFLLFTSQGVAGKVIYDLQLSDADKHLSLMPEDFHQFKSEPAFSTGNASFFFWHTLHQLSWTASPEALAEYPLLGFFVGGTKAYRALVKNYYEREIDALVLDAVFTSLAVTADQLAILNPDIKLDDLASDFQEILGRAI